MNAIENYEAAATGARAALDAAKAAPTVETYRHAASLLLAAGVLARACGNATEMRAHNAAGREAMVAASKLENGEQLEAGGPGSGPKPSYLSNSFSGEYISPFIAPDKKTEHGIAAVSKTANAQKASHDASMKKTKASHQDAQKAHTEAAEAHKKTGSKESDSFAKLHERAALEHGKAAISLESSNALNTDALSAAAASRMAADTELQAGITAGGYSNNDVQQAVRDAVCGMPLLNTPANGTNCISGSVWVADIIFTKAGDKSAIVQGADGKLYAVEFTMDGKTATVTGEPKQVERVTDYDYVFNPEKAKPVAAAKATETPALDASRATEATANRYKNAAAEAQGASGSIKETHKKAMHLHKIAAECADMCGDEAGKGKHEAMAQKHGAALEADYDMPMDMAARNAATAAALEAGGPGSGPQYEETGKNLSDLGDSPKWEGEKFAKMKDGTVVKVHGYSPAGTFSSKPVFHVSKPSENYGTGMIHDAKEMKIK